MSDDAKDSSHVSDPMTYMVSVAVELHEMKRALIEAGFTSKEALFLVGQAVAAGAMLPISDFGPDDISSNAAMDIDDEDFDEEDNDGMV
jgi:hypothetical protein